MAQLAHQLHRAEVRRLEQLAQARAVLAGGGNASAARSQTGLDRTVIANHFDERGRLLVTQAVERTLGGRATEQIERLAALPRALRPVDMNILAQVLKDNPGATDGQLRDAVRRAEVSRAAINYLFAAGTSLHDRLMTLPPAQLATLLGAHVQRETPPAATPAGATPVPVQPQASASPPASVPAQAPAPTPPLDPVHRRHLQESRRFDQVVNAHLLIAHGLGLHAAANRSGLPAELVARAFSNDGRLLLNAAGQEVARSADEATARRFAALPRALEAADLARLAELLRVLPDAAEPLLRESSLGAGVSPEAVAHLFDTDVPLHERLASLPDHQREALESALARPPTPALEPSPPVGSPAATPGEVPPQGDAGLPPEVRDDLEQHLFGDAGPAPVPSPRRSPSPAELSDGEISWLRQTLGMSPHASGAAQAESTASQETTRPSSHSGPAGESSSAQAQGLSQEMLAFVGEFLRKETEHAQRFVQARELLAGGASMGQAARAIGIKGEVLGNSFSDEGHLLLNQAAERLLNARDPANAAPFAGLPRALTRSDLALLGRVFRENPGASEDELHSAAMRARVSRRAIAHLFDSGEPLLARWPPCRHASSAASASPRRRCRRRPPGLRPRQRRAQLPHRLLHRFGRTPRRHSPRHPRPGNCRHRTTPWTTSWRS